MTFGRYSSRMMLAPLSLIALTVLQSRCVSIAQDMPDNGTVMGTCDCVDAITAAKTAASTEIDLFQGKLLKSEEEANALRGELSNCEGDRTASFQRNEKRIEELLKQLEEAEASDQTLIKKFSQMEKDIVTTKSALLSSKQTVTELTEALDGAKAELSGSKQTVTELTEALDGAKGDLSNSKQTVTELTETLDKINKKVGALDGETDTLKAELSNSKQIVTEITDALDGAKAELSDSKKTVTELTEALDGANRKASMLGNELARAKEMLSDATTLHQTEIQKLREIHAKDRAEIESNHNDALQKATALENSLTRVKSQRDLKTKDMEETVNSLTHDLEKHKKMLKDSKNKFFDTRQELFATNAELRKMHERASVTYCNTTLMMEDSTKIFSIVGTKFSVFWDEFYTETLVPFSRTLERIKEMFIVETEILYNEHLAEHVVMVKNTVKDLYNDYVTPVVDEQIMPLVNEHVMPLVDKYRDPVSEVVQSVRLTAISVVKHTSKAAYAYLAVREIDEGGLSRPAGWVLSQLEYCKINSEEFVDTAVMYLPLFLAMTLMGCLLVGTLAVYFGLSTGYVWAYCAICYLFRPRPKKFTAKKAAVKKNKKGKASDGAKVKSQ